MLKKFRRGIFSFHDTLSTGARKEQERIENQKRQEEISKKREETLAFLHEQMRIKKERIGQGKTRKTPV